MPRDGTFAAGLVRQRPIVRVWRLWRQRLRERRLARQFADRDLRDLGLTRGDLYRELARPFWQGSWRSGGGL